MRLMSSFDVLVYVPRDATFSASDMTAFPLTDRFALLRDSLLTVPRLGLNDDVPGNAEPLNSILHLKASFNEIPNKFRRFRSVVRGRMLVLTGVTNRDIGVWKSNLSTFMRDRYSGAMPPGADTAIDMLPLPARKGMTGSVSSGGSVTRHATFLAFPRSRLIFNTQRRRRLQQAPRRRRSLLYFSARRLLQGKTLQILSRSGRSRRAGGRKHERQPPRLGIEQHRKAGGRRNS